MTTKGGLNPAKIYDPMDMTRSVEFMFNPHQYTVTLAHKFKEDAGQGGKQSKVELTQVGQLQLTLPKVVFDTYMSDKGAGDKEDVSKKTQGLFDLMEPLETKEGEKSQKFKARSVIFEWGPSFSIECFIESVKQTFTLFAADGTPVRAEVEIKLKHVPQALPGQNPTSGGGLIQRIWRVSAGDRLDVIAAEVYNDATLWRQIADYNGINSPLALRPGMELSIPPQD
jgi:hypothetical protein